MRKVKLPGRSSLVLLLSLLLVCSLAAGYFLYRKFAPRTGRSRLVLAWLNSPSTHADWAVKAGQRCAEAPFMIPTDGFIGYLWGDSFQLGHRHQGIDIFGGQDVDLTPVVAAYAGYLTRLADWKSSLIIRVPDDPLFPGRQIWTYYTHMASSQGASFIAPEFPPGTREVFVEAGALLGYQGNYSGDPGNPVGVHLHFSIVQDDDQGNFRNELEIKNTLDPSPYLGLPLNAALNRDIVPVCGSLEQIGA
jgi:murein DD-endopeptidase MepM/ murein hydrolase activator NlpD